MKASILRKAVASGVAIATLLPIAAFAQVGTTVGQMPVLYSSTGTAMNTSGTSSLGAGYYYLSPGGQQVYYFGNGTYYNPATGEYGGNIGNPTGRAGSYTATYYPVAQAPTQTVPGVADNSLTPGVPNTGAGGGSLAAWVTLVVSGVAMVGGLIALAWSRRNVLS